MSSSSGNNNNNKPTSSRNAYLTFVSDDDNKKIEISTNLNSTQNTTIRARSCSPYMLNSDQETTTIAPISKLVSLAVQANKQTINTQVTNVHKMNKIMDKVSENSDNKIQTGMDRYITVLKRGRSPKSAQIASTAKVPKDGKNIKNSENRFAILTEQGDEVTTNTSLSKPPPIYLREQNSSFLVKSLISLIGENEFYVTPIKRGKINETKIQVSKENNYRKIVSDFETKNKNFYTYQLKSAKGLTVVIKGIDSSVDPEEVKSGLENSGFKVKNVSNIKNREKIPQPIFRVELQPGDIKIKINESHPIYDLKYLLHRRVTVEQPHKRAGPIQCLNCQEFGHTKTYCKLPTVCVVCGELHSTANCDKTKGDPKAKKCGNCGGNHTANYRGCPFYSFFKRFSHKKENNIPAQPITLLSYPQLPQPSTSQQQYSNVLKSNETIAQQQPNSQFS